MGISAAMIKIYYRISRLDRVWGVIWTKVVNWRSLSGAQWTGYLSSPVCQNLQPAHFTHLYYFSGLWDNWPQSNPTGPGSLGLRGFSGKTGTVLGKPGCPVSLINHSIWQRRKIQFRQQMCTDEILRTPSVAHEPAATASPVRDVTAQAPPQATWINLQTNESPSEPYHWSLRVSGWEQNLNVGLLKLQICCPCE